MKNKKNAIILSALTFFVIVIVYTAVSYNKNANETIEVNSDNYTISFDKIERIIDHQYKDRGLLNKEIYLFINMNTFTCHQCYEQFLKIVEIINSKYKKDTENVLLLFPEEKEEGKYQTIKLKKWLQSINVSYKYLILKSESEVLNIKRSRIILKKKDLVEFTIPMQVSEYDRFEKLL
jgi:hypothetical protein